MVPPTSDVVEPLPPPNGASEPVPHSSSDAAEPVPPLDGEVGDVAEPVPPMDGAF